MSLEQDIYYQKYLKYKEKYLRLKKQFGGVTDCNTNFEDNSMFYNIYGNTVEILKNIDNDYSGTRGTTDSRPNNCNLWIWNKRNPSTRKYRNHLDLYYLNIDKVDGSTYNDIDNIISVEFGISAKTNGITTGQLYSFDVAFQGRRQRDIASEIAQQLEHAYRNIFG